MSKKVKRSSRGFTIGIVIFFMAGACVLLYPTVSNFWNQYRNLKLVSAYNQAVDNMGDGKYEQMLEQAREYNQRHTTNRILDAFEADYELSHPYATLLNPNGDEIMGYLEIPEININLVIYHGVGRRALEKGCGHLEGTSLPIGGPGTHSVLAAHRGLPSARLFTDLDQIKKGDVFYIRVLHKKMQYKVDQIKTVLPDESQYLAIEQGQDYVTLLTCTPYGVNTHRLLVRGHRTAWVEPEDESNSQVFVNNIAVKLLIAGTIVFLLFTAVLWSANKRLK